MTALFGTILSMSLTASYAALGVLLVRLLLKRAPKVFSYALWAAVWFRLICPVSFESFFSLIPSRAAVPAAELLPQGPAALSPALQGAVPQGGAQAGQAAVPPLTQLAQPAPSLPPWREVLAVVWLAGILLLVCYAAVSYLRLRRRLATATLVRENIFETDRIHTAFVLGLFKPKIFLPVGVQPDEADYILHHEQTHLRRFDHFIKPAAFLVLCVHWFNPLIWLCYHLLCRDMEMSCDESVVKQLGSGIRKGYSGSLLALSERQNGLYSPLAFGESGVKARIKNILNYKKPAFWVVILCIAAVAAVTIGFAANPRRAADTLSPDISNFGGFDLEKVQVTVKTFAAIQENDPVKIGEAAIIHYYSGFMGEDVPKDYRITDFSVSDVTLLAGDQAEFCVSAMTTYTTTGSYFMSANGNGAPTADGDGTRWSDCYVEFRVKSLGDGNYEIVGIGTGGGAQGLTPAAAANGPALGTAYLFDPEFWQDDTAQSPVPLANIPLTEEQSNRLYSLLGAEDSWQAAPEGDYPSLRYVPGIRLASAAPLGPQIALYDNINGQTCIAVVESIVSSKMPREYYASKEVYDNVRAFIVALLPTEPNSETLTAVKARLKQEVTALEKSLQEKEAEQDGHLQKLYDFQKSLDGPPDKEEMATIQELNNTATQLMYECAKLEDAIKKKQQEIKLCDMNITQQIIDSSPMFSEWRTYQTAFPQSIDGLINGSWWEPKGTYWDQWLGGTSSTSAEGTTTLPDYHHSGDGAIEQLIYDHEVKAFAEPEVGFTVVAVKIHKTVEAGGKTKVFLTTAFSRYRIDNGTVIDQGGGLMPSAVELIKDDNGSYRLYTEAFAGNGSDFIPSIHLLCTMPDSQTEIEGLADSILKDYANPDALLDTLRQNLTTHLKANGYDGLTVKAAP